MVMLKTKILAVCNNKGGVGKTFIVKTLAEYFACIRQLRVLVIDLDPQTNLSRRFIDMQLMRGTHEDYIPPLHPERDEIDPDWEGYSNSADIWFTGSVVAYPTRIDNLEINPGHASKLADLELLEKKDVYTQIVMQLRQHLNLDDIKNDYDVILIDTRPSKGPLVQAALHAATDLLIPSQMEAPSVEGLYGMMGLRNNENTKRSPTDPLNLIGILPNMYKPGTKIHEEFYEALMADNRIAPSMISHKIHDWVGYKESMIFAAPSLFKKSYRDKHRVQMTEIGDYIFHQLFGENA